MKTKLIRSIAIAMIAIMLVGLLPTIAFADDPIVISSIEIGSPAPLNVAYQEKELGLEIGESFYLAPEEAGYTVDPSNSFLSYYVEGTGNWVQAYSQSQLSADTTYAVTISLDLRSGYDWPEAIKSNETPDFTGFTVNVAGTPIDLGEANADYYYNDYWNSFNFQVVLGKPSDAPIVKNVDIPIDRKAVQKGFSFDFDATVSGTAEATFAWSIIGAESASTLIDENGKLTVGEDESASSITVRATSTVDASKYDEAIVTVLSQAPTMTIGDLGEYDEYAGNTIYFYAYRSGTETDRTLEWSISGNLSEKTKITSSGYEYADATFTIGDDETAETIIVTVRSIHHPEVYATATVNVLQAEKVNDIYLNLDTSELMLDPAKTEGELQELIRGYIEPGEVEGTYYENNYLLYQQDNGAWSGIGDGNKYIDLNRRYAVSVTIYPMEGYDWTNAVKEGDYSGLTFHLNGAEHEVAEYGYNSYWNCIEVVFVPVLVNAEFTGASLNIGTDLSLNYYVKVYNTEAAPENKLAVQFSYNGITYLVKDHTTNAQGDLVFKFLGIAPHQMTESIDAKLVLLGAGNSIESLIDAKDDYCVEKYIGTLLAETTNGSLKLLLGDLIAYGAAAQYYVGNTGVVVGSRINEYWQTSVALPQESDALIITGNTTDSCKIKSVGVRYDEVNNIFIKIYSLTDNFKVTVDGTEYTVDDCDSLGENLYKLTLEDLTAGQINKRYTIVLNDGTNDVATLEYGAAAYAKAIYDNDLAPQTQKDLSLALYRYGVSAKAYIDAQ